MARTEYQRLTRSRNRSLFAVAAVSRASLWLGDDHLLLVSTNGYAETYKRFYFRDIQAFVMERTSTFRGINIVLIMAIVLLATFAIVASVAGVKIFLFALAGILVVFACLNVLQGQTCRCFLRTAVQTEELPPLNRVRRARKAFARLRPLVAAAQGGELSPQMIAEQLRAELPAAEPAAVTGAPEIPPLLNS
jgi:hypothetical protein